MLYGLSIELVSDGDYFYFLDFFAADLADSCLVIFLDDVCYLIDKLGGDYNS